MKYLFILLFTIALNVSIQGAYKEFPCIYKESLLSKYLMKQSLDTKLLLYHTYTFMNKGTFVVLYKGYVDQTKAHCFIPYWAICIRGNREGCIYKSDDNSTTLGYTARKRALAERWISRVNG